MLRNYLVDIHKFYANKHNGDMNFPLMPIIVLVTTITSLLAGLDILINDSQVLMMLKNIHDFMVAIPGFFMMIPLYYWYKQNLPSKEELRSKKGMWNGIIICTLSVLFAMIMSIIKL